VYCHEPPGTPFSMQLNDAVTPGIVEAQFAFGVIAPPPLLAYRLTMYPPPVRAPRFELAKVTWLHVTVTFDPDTEADGVLPVGRIRALLYADPAPSADQAANATPPMDSKPRRTPATMNVRFLTASPPIRRTTT
jgi:hypothetical protein